MGRAAAKYADYIIITSDNPRSENPLQIIDMILEGIKEKSNPPEYEVIVDREEAINRAIEIAADDDIVVLAGKGHENYQIIGTEKLYFDEREIVKKAIERFKK
jgi:UDP-N-acetylmuramoyl-L-alanyl-D-glutamate--2,6-diaminopimelate ligase